MLILQILLGLLVLATPFYIIFRYRLNVSGKPLGC